LTVGEQCELLSISRSAYYYRERAVVSSRDEQDLTAIKETLTKRPFYGYRRVACELRDAGMTMKRARRLMRYSGLRAVYPKRRTSVPRVGEQKYPYLLRGKEIWLPNQVWATDITYLPVAGGAAYLAAIIDLYSRKILTWRLSNTLTADFCVEALAEALRRFGTPAIFNSDQGRQFTSAEFVQVLQEAGVAISMDGKGRAFDNILVERTWRTVKYEDIFLRGYGSMLELRQGLSAYVNFYNGERFHSALGYSTPDAVSYGKYVEAA
jgi:putative transposase